MATPAILSHKDANIRSMTVNLDPDRRLLLATCAVPRIRWDLVAREAERPGGLDALTTGELHETSKAADAARELLRDSAETLDERLARVDEMHEEATAAGARLVTVLDDDYPANLRLIFNAPPFFYVLGHLIPDDARSVAVVGTRDASAEGVDLAASMADALSREGVTVVSGMARGIDTAAHRATLDAEGRTVAVMGTGILNRYPKENADLADEIVASGGALVSQFWPTSPPLRGNFPLRNVVTSGISQGTVVVEASSTSGAKMQARLALEHGKTVFLVRQLVTREEWARDYLAKRPGAVEVESAADVVARLRPRGEIDSVTHQRRQLALDLS